jgi:hypothetical protein
LQLMKALSLALVVLLICGSAFAAPTPETSKRAVQAYAAAAQRASTFADLKPYWSAKFASANAALYAQQIAPFPAQTRALLEKRLLGAVAENAQKSAQNLSITCAAPRCTAVAKLPSGITQTYWLVEERGAVLIDDANTAVGP